MAEWDDGYVTDVVYTHNAYREMTPSWLAATALLLGQRPPDLGRPFRYADLGCGHGLTATMVAATCPHAEVWAFDFNPAHVESGRLLAAAAGLTNIHFQEASFAELAALPGGELPAFDLPAFDFIVSHGVASWISAENRARVFQIIGQRLRPGGLAYLSYNVMAGWASMMPVRALMRMLLRSAEGRSDQAATGVLDYLDLLKASGAQFFAVNPTVDMRLADMRKQDARYIAHEFLNADWQPLLFADVQAAMGAVKCNYLGSATLAENIDAVSVPPTMMTLMNETTDPVLRETLRDLGLGQTFRRDIYRRGLLPLAGVEQARLIDALELAWTGRPVETPIVLHTPLGQVSGLAEIYGPIMSLLSAANQTIGAIRRSPALAMRPVPELLQAVSLLMSSGYVHPALPLAVREQSERTTLGLNQAIARVCADGGELDRLAAATIGSEFTADVLLTLVVQEVIGGQHVGIDAVTDRVLAALTRSGRSVQRDGKSVVDLAEARAILSGSIAAILDQRIPLLIRLGVLPAMADTGSAS